MAGSLDRNNSTFVEQLLRMLDKATPRECLDWLFKNATPRECLLTLFDKATPGTCLDALFDGATPQEYERLLKDNATPREYLRLLQEQTIRQRNAIGRDPSLAARTSKLSFSPELVDEIYKALGEPSGLDKERLSESIRKAFALELPTSLEQPLYYSLLLDNAKKFEEAGSRLGYELSEEVAFGTLPTGQINGKAYRVPAGGLVIAIDDGVFGCFYLLAKAVALFLRVEEVPGGWRLSSSLSEWDHELQTNEEGHRRYLEALVASFVLDRPEQAPPHPLADMDPRRHLVTALAFPAEAFIVAHEYAHLFLGHYERGIHTEVEVIHTRRDDILDVYKLDADGTPLIEVIHTRCDDELEADSLALSLIFDSFREADQSTEVLYFGLYFLFSCLTLIEQLWGTGSDHPSVDERMTRVLSRLGQLDRAEKKYGWREGRANVDGHRNRTMSASNEQVSLVRRIGMTIKSFFPNVFNDSVSTSSSDESRLSPQGRRIHLVMFELWDRNKDRYEAWKEQVLLGKLPWMESGTDL